MLLRRQKLERSLSYRTDPRPLVAFTDGSGYANKVRNLARAGYAVVTDNQRDFGERTVNAQIRANPDQHFHTRHLGRVPGRQTVPRAELYAIAKALCLARHVCVVSDCQYAIDVTQHILDGKALEKWRSRPNFDLVIHVHSAVHAWKREERKIQILKIKSHVENGGADTKAFHELGNSIADIAAKKATYLEMNTTLGQWHSALQDVHLRRETLPDLYRAIAQALRIYSRDIQTFGQPKEQHRQIPDLMCIQGIGNPYFQRPDGNFWRPISVWGTTFNACLMRWLEQLSWPEEHDCAAPVLWIELLTSFRLTTKCPIPLQLPAQQGVYLTPGIHTIHSMPCLSLGAEACSFQNALKSLALILDQKLVPWHLGKTKCDTIPIFGFHLHASGLLLRPSFPHSQEVRVCLYKYLTSQKGKPSTSSRLDLPSERIPPEPEDVSQSAGSKRSRFASFMRARR